MRNTAKFMSISFPYRKRTIEEGVIHYPVVYLPVKTKFGLYLLRFLVDSGADTTTLPIKLAPLFGFKPTKDKKSWISGVESGKIAAYASKIEIGFDKKFYKVRCVFVESNVIPLLGRLDIWDKFSIVFDNIKQEVVFKPIRK